VTCTVAVAGVTALMLNEAAAGESLLQPTRPREDNAIRQAAALQMEESCFMYFSALIRERAANIMRPPPRWSDKSNSFIRNENDGTNFVDARVYPSCRGTLENSRAIVSR
jgi:hypothetical protein